MKSKVFFRTCLSFLLLLSFTVALASGMSAAEVSVNTAPWDGSTVATSFAGGDGSASNPYIIASADQFVYLREKTNKNELNPGDIYILACDIDLGGVEWAPIGTSANLSFNGRLDGRGYTIRNYNIVATAANVGFALFGYLASDRGEIVNLKIADVNVSGTVNDTCVGALVGFVQGGYVAGITIEDSVVFNMFDGSIGGISGRVETGSIMEYCKSYAVINVVATHSSLFVGGITGVVGYGGEVRYCVNYGTINTKLAEGYTTEKLWTGGIAGIMGSSSLGGYISNCYNIGAVHCDVAAGGIAGYTNTAGNVITDCYNLSEAITGNPDQSGSIVGYITRFIDVANCYGAEQSELGMYGNDAAAAQTDFSGFNVGVKAAMREEADKIDQKIADELAKLAAIEYDDSYETTPDETTPDETTPDATTPDDTTPDDTTPDATTPDDTTPDATTPDDTTPGKTDDKKGCGSSLSIVFLPLALSAGAALTFRRKRK